MASESPNRIARVGSVLALLGSLIWVQWPIDLSRFNIAAVILLVAALVTWVSTELADFQESTKYDDNVMSDDVSKINALLKIIDKNQYYILKQKAIQTYMGDNDYKGVVDIIYYKENDIFPFHNQKIHLIYDRLSTEAREFISDFYTLYTSDGRGRSTWRSPDDRYVSDEIYQEVMAKIALLNDRVSKLVELWEELVNVARRELKGASKAVERYDM